MQFLATGWLTLIQAIDYLIDKRQPDLRVKISRERLELDALAPRISRAPPPISPVGRGGGRSGPPERSAPIDAKVTAEMEARNQLRARLEEDLRNNLWKDQATWATERERAIARLGQALCDAAFSAWLLMETTGERTPIPAPRWSTREGMAAFQSGSYTLITAVSIIKGTVVVLAADLDRWLAAKDAPRAPSQTPPIPKRRGPRSYRRDPTVDRMVEDYAGQASALDDELEKSLSEKYGVSRTTARDAKTIALSKLRQTPT
jgi:hypothetical protein